MYGDKKKVVSAILGADGEPSAASINDAESGDDVHHVISGELIDAVHAKDSKAVSEALKAHHAHMTASGSNDSDT